jgi:hypothetical protein
MRALDRVIFGKIEMFRLDARDNGHRGWTEEN